MTGEEIKGCFDDEAVDDMIRLRGKVYSYRRLWVWQRREREEVLREILAGCRLLSAWVSRGRISPECREALLKYLKSVEYHCLKVTYWGPQPKPWEV